MARILISESHEDVRRLLEQMVSRLGHEPVVVEIATPEALRSADAAVVEPAVVTGAVFAQAAHLADPSLPLICASVAAPPPELAELGVVFTASLVKPFKLDQLRASIDLALASRVAHGRDRSAGELCREEHAA
jgi:CheY-like chemotaxis protein